MTAVEQLITDNFDIWSSAIKTKSAAGRGRGKGNGKKFELYGINKLRGLILDLAVRGLLVPQDPNDEPASELLKKIAADKSKLVKEGKLKKAKPHPEVNTSEIRFDLPSGWEWGFIPDVVINDRYAIKRGPFGSSIKKDFFVPSGYKVYEQQHAINDDFSLGEYYVDEKKYNELKAFVVKPNDLIISCSGTVGKVAIAPPWMEPGIINQALLKLALNEEALTNSYFKILFPAFYMKTDTLSDLQGTAQKNMVSVDTLKKEPFPLPPLVEQNRIVAKVDELMALCDQLEQQTETSISAHQTLVRTVLEALTRPTANADAQDAKVLRKAGQAKTTGGSEINTSLQGSNLLEQRRSSCREAIFFEHFDTLFTTEWSIDQLKQTILQLAVMGKLVPQNPNDEPASELLKKIAAEKAKLLKEGKIKKQKPLPPIKEDEKPFELPEGWEWVRLPEIGELARGKSKHRPRNAPVLYNNGDIPLVQTGDVSRSNGLIETYTALYNETGFAQSRLWPKGTMCITIAANIADTGVLGFDACFPDSVVGFIPLNEHINVRYFDYFIRTAKNHLEEYAPSTAQKNINLEILGQLLVPCPPLRELESIVSKVDELMILCDTLKTRINTKQTTQLQLADAMAEQAVS